MRGMIKAGSVVQVLASDGAVYQKDHVMIQYLLFDGRSVRWHPTTAYPYWLINLNTEALLWVGKDDVRESGIAGVEVLL